MLQAKGGKIKTAPKPCESSEFASFKLCLKRCWATAFACTSRLAEAKPERETDTVIEEHAEQLNKRLGERLRKIHSEDILAVVCFNIPHNQATYVQVLICQFL